MHGDENDDHQSTRAERRATGRRSTDSGSGRLRRARVTRVDAAAAETPTSLAAVTGATRPAVAASTRPIRRNGRARVFATILVIPAIFGTVALPAYAFVPDRTGFEASGIFSLTVAGAQDLDVPVEASGAPVSKDGFAITTKAEIDAAAAAAAAAERASRASELASRGTGAYSVVTQRAPGDDYPWWSETIEDEGGGFSPLRYYYRECVDFVAWRLNRDAGVTSAPWKWTWANLASGSAYAWADEWEAKGWPTSSVPVVGAVAWFPYNHVGYVQAVNPDGTVTLEDYNLNQSHAYSTRTIPASEALYLYPPG